MGNSESQNLQSPKVLHHSDGDYVPKRDYEKLKEEVNRLHEKYDFQLLVKRNENLQNLLGECEEAMSDLISMEILIYGRISNLHGGAIINLNNVLQKIKAARGGNE